MPPHRFNFINQIVTDDASIKNSSTWNSAQHESPWEEGHTVSALTESIIYSRMKTSIEICISEATAATLERYVPKHTISAQEEWFTLSRDLKDSFAGDEAQE